MNKNTNKSRDKQLRAQKQFVSKANSAEKPQFMHKRSAHDVMQKVGGEGGRGREIAAEMIQEVRARGQGEGGWEEGKGESL